MEKVKDVNLSDGDVVIVKPYDTRVYIGGEIKRPAFYDMIAGESLSQLLTFAGGVTDMIHRTHLWSGKKVISEQ